MLHRRSRLSGGLEWMFGSWLWPVPSREENGTSVNGHCGSRQQRSEDHGEVLQSHTRKLEGIKLVAKIDKHFIAYLLHLESHG